MRFKKNVLGYLADRSVCPSGRREDEVLRERYAHSEQLYSKDFVGHYGCVNAIEFSHGVGKHIASGGDDRRVLLWDVEKMLSDIGKPAVMKGEHNSNIFCMAFDIHNKMLFSGGNDEQVIVHDLTTGETKDVFTHDDAVYGLSPDPTNPSVFASSCDDGRVLIFDTRDSCADPFCLANYASSMHSVMYNPVEPRLLATANAKAGVALWDVRKPRTCLLRYGGGLVEQSCMSVRFNQRGDQIIALRRRLPPVLYKIHSSVPVCEFDHSGYYNSCTMKSICFAGDNDQYVLSGSDEFNLYMWALPEDLSERSYINSAHMVLKGHRSIVNQVRFNPSNHLIISSGVEKIIKVWSPFKHHVKQKKGEQDERSHERRVYTHEEYINLVLQNGNVMSHDYTQESTEEDPRMMAFFDSLVQRELDGWSSDDSLSSNEEALYNRIMAMSQSDIDSDDSFPDLGQDDVDDPAYSPFTIAFASVMASQAAEGNDRFPRLNRALESAERRYAEENNDNHLENSDYDNDLNVIQDLQGSDSDSESDEDDDSSHERLTALIKRKKQELKEAMKRRMKYPFAEVFSADSGSSGNDDSDDEDEGTNKTTDTSADSLNIQTNGSQEHKIKNNKQNESKESIYAISQIAESNKQAQIKLQRLKDFRKRLLDNDSDGSDLEIHEKKLDSVINEKKLDLEVDEMKLELESIMNPSASNSSSCVGTERVQFKKFKRSNTVATDKGIEKVIDSKDLLNVRQSSDLGPYLQRAGTSSTVEVRQVAAENDIVERKGKLSSDSFSFKGKNKLKTSHRHYRESDQRKEDSHKIDSDRNRKSERDSRERKDRGLSEDGHSMHMFNKPEHRKHDHRHSTQSEHAHKHREHVTSRSEYPYQHDEHLHKHSKHMHKHSGDLHKHVDHLQKHGEHSCKHSGYMHRHSEHTSKHTHRRRSKSDSYIDGDERWLSYNERKEHGSGHRHRHRNDRMENEYKNRGSHDKDKLSKSLDAIKDDKVGSITENKHNGEGLPISREGEKDSTKKTEKERRKSENDQNEKNGKMPEYGDERDHNKSTIGRTVSVDKTRLANNDSKNNNIQEADDDVKDIPSKNTSYQKHYLSDEEERPNRKRSRQIHHMDEKEADTKTGEKFKNGMNNTNAELKEIMLSEVNNDVCKNCDKMKNSGPTERDIILDELDQTKNSLICKKCALPIDSTKITHQNANGDDSKMENASDSENKLTVLKVKPQNNFVNDGEKPSCSKNFSDKSEVKKTCGQETDALDSGKPKNRKLLNARKEENSNRRDSSSDDEQLTWLEFKRFKNRMERVRKRYKEEKHQRKMERRHSDDK